MILQDAPESMITPIVIPLIVTREISAPSGELRRNICVDIVTVQVEELGSSSRYDENEKVTKQEDLMSTEHKCKFHVLYMEFVLKRK